MLNIRESIIKFSLKKKIIIGVCAIIILQFSVITGQLLYYTQVYDKIYKGIKIGDIPVGGLTRKEAELFLNSKYNEDVQKLKVTLTIENLKREISYKDLDVKYNIEATVNKAYNIGRTGNIFNRAYGIFGSSTRAEEVWLEVSFDKDKLKSYIQDIYNKTLKEVKQPSFSVNGNIVTLYPGMDGKKIDQEKAITAVECAIKEQKDEPVEIPIETVKHDNANAKELYNKICTQPKDATCVVENNKIRIVPEEYGRQIDKSALEHAVEKLNTNFTNKETLKVVLVEPKIRVRDLEGKMLQDTLSFARSYFNTDNVNNQNRSVNIGLATSKIDGVVLAPGGIFSFNKIVGPRTASLGYKDAHTYVGGKIVDGTGGGVCQVSTTLYNAALYADMEIVERTNHMFTVGYAKYGLDATVSYGGPDLKFKNNSKWPVQIKGSVSSSNELSFTIIGTKDNPGKTIEMKNDIVKTIPSTTGGSPGYVVDTYKIVKIDGVEVSNTKLYTSTYAPMVNH